MFCSEPRIIQIPNCVETSIQYKHPSFFCIGPFCFFSGKSFQQLNFERRQQKLFAGTCQYLVRKKRRKSSQFLNFDIYLPFSLLFILWGMHAQEVPRAPDHRQLNLLPHELDLPAQLRQDQVGGLDIWRRPYFEI
jgi:hypothetical protein